MLTTIALLIYIGYSNQAAATSIAGFTSIDACEQAKPEILSTYKTMIGSHYGTPEGICKVIVLGPKP